MTKEETKTFLELLAEVPDHRKGNAVRYELKDILFLGMIAILCGANTYTGMALFAELLYEELSKYVHLRKLPSHDIFGDIFSRVDIAAVERFLSLQRKHWAIENNLHRSLDCCFHEDDAHIRMGHAAIVLNMFRKLCMQMLKADTTTKGSMASKRQRYAWSFDFARYIIDQWISASVPSIS